MVLTDEAALIILGLTALFVAFLIGLFGFGIFLYRRGYRVIGTLLGLAVVAFVVGPLVLDALQWVRVRADVDRRNMWPEELPLVGQRILFIETGGTLCGDICGDVVSLGIDADIYWLGAGSYIPEDAVEVGFVEILSPRDSITRISLGAPQSDLGAQRYPEAVESTDIPDFDLVFVHDGGAYLAYFAPELLGPPLPSGFNAQAATLVFDDWPDPFEAAPPEPRFRFVEVNVRRYGLLFWPFSNRSMWVPPWDEFHNAWRAIICPQAGSPDMRDAFTYGFMCNQE